MTNSTIISSEIETNIRSISSVEENEIKLIDTYSTLTDYEREDSISFGNGATTTVTSDEVSTIARSNSKSSTIIMPSDSYFTKEKKKSKGFWNNFIQLICCGSDGDEEQENVEPASLRQMFRFASRRDSVYIFLGTLLAILVGAIQPSVCLLGGKIDNIFIKTVNPVGDTNFQTKTYRIVYIYLGLGTAMFLLAFIQQYLLQVASHSIVSKMRRAFLSSILRQDAHWIDTHSSGTLSAKLGDSIDRIDDGIADKWGLIVRGLSMFISSCVIAFVIEWKTAFVMIGLAPLSAITMILTAKISEKPTKRMMNAATNAHSVAEESVLNVRTVAAHNAQEDMVQKYSQLLKKGLKWAIRLSLVSGCLEGIMFFELYTFVAGGFLYGILSRWNGGIQDPGNIFIVVNTVCFGAYFVGILGPHMSVLLKARIAAASVLHIIDREPDTKTDENKKVTQIRGDIEFKDVYFTYPTRDAPILKGVSFSIKSGETVAFVGHSGSGKSTTIGLITALYAANKGTVFLDGHDVNSLDEKGLRKQIGIVQQEPNLFTGTIRENICLGRNISEERMVEVAKIANAHEFVGKLEKGYDTLIGTGGAALSGGQKQRIAIARSLVTEPMVLLMDEATSALDSHSEHVVQMALKENSNGRTTIMIAHRLCSLKYVDRIIVFDGGKIVEQGTHEQLVALSGLYAKLARAQQIVPEERISEEEEFLTQLPAKRSSVNTLDNFRRSIIGRRSLVSAPISSVSLTIQSQTDQRKKIDDFSSRDQSSWYALWKFYKDTFRECPFMIIAAQIASLLRGLELPFYCLFQKIAYDALDATEETYTKPLIQSCVLFASLGIFCWITITIASVFSGWSAEVAVNGIRVRTLRCLLNKEISFFDRNNTSAAACASSLAQQAPNCKAALDNRFCIFSSDLSALIVCLGLCFGYCWQLGLLALGVITLLLCILCLLTYFVQKQSARQLKANYTSEIVMEIIDQSRTVQLLGVEEYFLNKYHEAQSRVRPLDNMMCVLQSLTFSFTQSFVFFSEAVGFALGLHLIYTGQVAADNVFMAVLCVSFCGWSLFFMQPSFNDVTRAASACLELYKLIDGSDTILDGGDEPDLDGSFSLESVDFAYPARQNHKVANNLSLSGGPGVSIALVGASGCGKSTVIGLLEKFYATNKGRVATSQHDINTISTAHLRSNMALVGQEPVLFSGTILENIVLGLKEVPMDEVRKACKQANAHHFIEAFPKGYQTEVGGGGHSLSGGQKQRIAIARSLVRKPKILLLDEATSALDTHSEQLVQNALNEAKEGRTSITIAHRLSTVRNAHCIYYIECGRVVECGTHDELVDLDGKYAALVRLQQMEL